MDISVTSILTKYLPLLIPILLIELGLLIVALVDLLKRPQTNGPKWLWVVLIVFIQIIGPIVYFIIGRKEE
jgi:Phospholipase_D-nuclease N-terminal